MNNNQEFIGQIAKQITEAIKPQLELSKGLKAIQDSARITMFRTPELNQTLIKNSQIVTNTFNKAVMESYGKTIQAMSEHIRASINVEPFKQIGNSIRPLVEYIENNKDKIQNFQDSTMAVVNQLMDLHKITEEEAFEMIDVLIEEEKIITHEDWSIELILEDDVTDIKRPSLTPSDIVNLILIFINLIQIFNGGEPLINIDIDNSETNIENQFNGDIHYHLNDTDYVINEYIVVNDTKLYKDYNIESDVITELSSGDKINRIVNEEDNDFMLVAIVNQDTEVEYTGWIRNEDVTLID